MQKTIKQFLEKFQHLSLAAKLNSGLTTLSIWILLLALSFFSFKYAFSGFVNYEAKNMQGIHTSFNNINTLSQTAMQQIEMLKTHIQETKHTMEDYESLIEQFEFIGQINTRLINLFLNPGDNQNKAIILQMTSSWNESFIKSDSDLKGFYPKIASALKSNSTRDLSLQLQKHFEQIYSILIDRTYNATKNVSKKLNSSMQNMQSISEGLSQNSTALDSILGELSQLDEILPTHNPILSFLDYL